ncbi:MAG: hypothetical protein HRU40_20730 [Saprospiraceae bacterium]|nr:hypothetical protein [Saprospiraceae bacterium]
MGTHSGNSYFAFCQAIEMCGLPTKCFAIDTWIGDEQAGLYDKNIFEDVQEYNHKN